jgi:hypothetical protein
MLTSPGIVIDHHVLAGISIAGIVCDVMGGLYLAYDLLGGQFACATIGSLRHQFASLRIDTPIASVLGRPV